MRATYIRAAVAATGAVMALAIPRLRKREEAVESAPQLAAA